jgi:hypothetical protein
MRRYRQSTPRWDMQMSDHWNFYALLVDDQPASIFVDLGIAKNAP